MDVGSGCEECSTAFSLDPLADFGPVEIVEIALPAATSGMHRRDCLQRCLEALLAQQLAECVENDAIADAEEEMERSRHDALRRDGEEWLLVSGARVFVVCIAIASSFDEAALLDNADGAGMSGGRGHEAEGGVEEA